MSHYQSIPTMLFLTQPLLEEEEKDRLSIGVGFLHRIGESFDRFNAVGCSAQHVFVPPDGLTRPVCRER